jgi:hypothetical protein
MWNKYSKILIEGLFWINCIWALNWGSSSLEDSQHWDCWLGIRRRGSEFEPRMFPSPCRGGPLGLLSNVYWRWSLPTHLQLVPRSGRHGSIHPLPDMPPWHTDSLNLHWTGLTCSSNAKCKLKVHWNTGWRSETVKFELGKNAGNLQNFIWSWKCVLQEWKFH